MEGAFGQQQLFWNDKSKSGVVKGIGKGFQQVEHIHWNDTAKVQVDEKPQVEHIHWNDAAKVQVGEKTRDVFPQVEHVHWSDTAKVQVDKTLGDAFQQVWNDTVKTDEKKGFQHAEHIHWNDPSKNGSGQQVTWYEPDLLQQFEVFKPEQHSNELGAKRGRTSIVVRKKKRGPHELREDNSKLERECEHLLEFIADLQMQIQSHSGFVDLEMENRLLRRTITEHRNFAANFQRAITSTPPTHASRLVTCRNSADYAVAEVLGLLTSSTTDASWRKGHVPGYPNILMHHQHLPHGVAATTPKRANLRFDFSFIPIPKEVMVEYAWHMWGKADMQEHFRAMGWDIYVEETGTELSDGETGASRILYYQENFDMNGTRVRRDCAFAIAKREMKIDESVFAIPGLECHGDPSDLATVVASTSLNQESDIEPERPGTHRFQSVQLEGGVFRDVPGGCSWSTVMSFPLNPEEGPPGEMINLEDGTLASMWVTCFDHIHAIMHARSGEETMESYRTAFGISPSTAERWRVRVESPTPNPTAGEAGE